MNDQIAGIVEDLKRDEGFVSHAYTDSTEEKYLTIGYGRLIDKRLGGGISEFEAECMLERDIVRAMDGLDAGLRWWRTMPEPWQRGLLNMAFNLGLPRLLGFRKMLAALEAGDGQRAAIECLSSKYAKDVGARAERVAALYWDET